MARRLFLRNYKFLFFILLFAFSPAQAEEEDVSFRLLNDDFEIALEVGPAFLQKPVFKGQAGIHPVIKVNHKQPRYIGVQLGWWANEYLLVQFGINFTSADFQGGEILGGDPAQGLGVAFQRRINQNENDFLATDDTLLSEGCEDGAISIFCVARAPLITQRENTYIKNEDEFADYFSLTCDEDCALTNARTAIRTDEARNRDLIANMAVNRFLATENDFASVRTEIGNFDVDNCGVDCVLEATFTRLTNNLAVNPIAQQATYNGFLEEQDEYKDARVEIANAAKNNKERCFTDCIDARARSAAEEAIRERGQNFLDSLTDANREEMIKGSPEYDNDDNDDAEIVCRDIATPANREACQLVEAERLILARGQTLLDDEQDKSNEAEEEFVKGREEYKTNNDPDSEDDDCLAIMTDAEDDEDPDDIEDSRLQCAARVIANKHTEENNEKYDNWVETQSEYRAARTSEACQGISDEDDLKACALTEARTNILNDWVKAQDQYNEALTGETCEDMTGDDLEACALTEAQRLIREDEDALKDLITSVDNENEAVNKAISAAIEGANITPETTISAGGTFLSVGSFINVYGNYPVANWLSIYGGGGIGLVWTKVDEGLITRTASLDITRRQRNLIIESLEGNSALGLTEDSLDSIDNALQNLSRSETVTRDISDTTLSYALSAGAGFRTEIFEGFTLDLGYQMQWNPSLYKQADAQWIHQMKVGFAFKF